MSFSKFNKRVKAAHQWNSLDIMWCGYCEKTKQKEGQESHVEGFKLVKIFRLSQFVPHNTNMSISHTEFVNVLNHATDVCSSCEQL